MIIQTPHYQGLNTSNHIEELLVQLAMKMGDLQASANNNDNNSFVITTDVSFNNETAKITTNQWVGTWVDGDFIVKNYFPSFSFPAGVGTYPFNRSNICDAFFHVAMFQQKMELSTAKNPGKVAFIDWSIANAISMGATQQAEITLNISDLPVLVTVNSDTTSIKAKPYLI